MYLEEYGCQSKRAYRNVRNPFALMKANEPLDECGLPPFLHFLSKQWENGHPIEILDISRYDYTQSHRALRILDGFSLD
jgi:hypothetical protein